MTEHLLNFIRNEELCQVEKSRKETGGKKRGPENFPVPPGRADGDPSPAKGVGLTSLESREEADTLPSEQIQGMTSG